MLDTRTQLYSTTVLRVQPQTGCIRTLDLAIPKPYPDFKPGQVIEIQIDPVFPLEGTSKRRYAICSLPSDRSLQICVDMVNVKGVSGSLFHLGEGEGLSISAPSGPFGLSESGSNNTAFQARIFMGLGAGIGVIRGLARQHFRQRQACPAQIYAINSGETAIPYEKELASDSEQYAGLDVYPILLTNGYEVDEILDRLMDQTLFRRKRKSI